MIIKPCVPKIRIVQKFIFVFDKTAYFTQKSLWNFFIRVDVLISCPSFSRVLHDSTQKHRKIRHFSRGIWLIIHDLHFLILIWLHKNHSFSLALPSEAIAIDELGSISPKLQTYTTFFLLEFIFHKKLQVVVGYRFFFCLVYYDSNKWVLKLTHILFCKQHKIMLKVLTHNSFNLFTFCVPDAICSIDSR